MITVIKISKRTEKQILAAVICTSLTFVYNVNTTFAAENENVQNEKNKSDSSAVSEVPTYQLDNYVVTANRMSMDKHTTGASTVLIDEETIERGNFSTVSDALRQSNINVVQKAGGSYPIINGDSRVLVLVNGHKLNWNHLVISGASSAGVDIDAIPMDNVARIEIVRGPNSSLYGNAAVGGVINIITKKPEVGQKTTINFEGGTWNNRKGTITTEGGNEDLRYMFSYSQQKRDDYKYRAPDGSNRTFKDSDLDRNSQTLRLDKKVGDDTLSFEYFRQHSKDGYGLYLTDWTQDLVYGYDDVNNVFTKHNRTETNYTLTYNFDGENGNNTDFIRIYRNGEKADSPFKSSSYTHDLKTFGTELQKAWNLNKDNTLLAGLSYTKEDIQEENSGVGFDKSANTTGLFLEDHWNLQNGWSLNLGSRLEHHSDFGTDVTSHISLNKELSPITNMFLSWGQAVNNPTLKNRFADTMWMVGNPNLKQEKSQTITLGLNSQIDDKTSFEASLYSSKLKNAFHWVSGYYSDPNDFTSEYIRGYYDNVAEEKRRGLELSLSHELSQQWKVRAGYSYAKVETKADSTSDFLNDDSNNRPNGYLLGLSYTQDKWNGDLTLQRVSGRSSNYFTQNSYTTLDLSLNYQSDENTKFYLKAYNLTNQSYDQFGSFFSANAPYEFYAEPGRSFVFGVDYSF